MAYDRRMRSLLRASFVPVLVLVVVSVACGDGGPSMKERAAAAKAEKEAADAKVREEIRAKLEQQRIAALWRYQHDTVGGGEQDTAAIFASDRVDVDGSGAKPVQLIFRDHQRWKRHAYLVLQAGDFNCRPRCTVEVTVDDQPPVKMDAWRPETDEAIAMFIRDHAKLWRLAGDAAKLTIAFPVKAGGTRSASFEVVGLDESKLAGWSPAP